MDYFAIIQWLGWRTVTLFQEMKELPLFFYEKRTIYIKMKLVYYLVVTIEYV